MDLHSVFFSIIDGGKIHTISSGISEKLRIYWRKGFGTECCLCHQPLIMYL